MDRPLVTLLATVSFLAAGSLVALIACACFSEFGNLLALPIVFFVGPVALFFGGGILLLRGSNWARIILALLFGFSGCSFITLSILVWTLVQVPLEHLAIPIATGALLAIPAVVLSLSAQLKRELLNISVEAK